MSSRRWPISSSVLGARDLRHQDGVGRGVRGGGEIVGMPGRVDAVDADEHLARAEAAGLDRVGDLLARGFLGVGRDRILEVEDDAVGRQASSPFPARGRWSPACRARCGADGWSCRRLYRPSANYQAGGTLEVNQRRAGSLASAAPHRRLDDAVELEAVAVGDQLEPRGIGIGRLVLGEQDVEIIELGPVQPERRRVRQPDGRRRR